MLVKSESRVNNLIVGLCLKLSNNMASVGMETTVMVIFQPRQLEATSCLITLQKVFHFTKVSHMRVERHEHVVRIFTYLSKLSF